MLTYMATSVVIDFSASLCYNNLTSRGVVMSHILYFMHDLAGVPHSVSLQKVGEIEPDIFKTLLDEFPYCESIGWNFKEVDEHEDFSEQAGVDLVFFDNDESIKFNFDSFCPLFDDYVSTKYPLITEYSVSTSFCESVYANMHNDSETIASRGQLMFIYDNSAGHVLHSVDDAGNHHSITPKAGDIIFLDISCNHALIPANNNSDSLHELLPLKMGLVAINNL